MQMTGDGGSNSNASLWLGRVITTRHSNSTLLQFVLDVRTDTVRTKIRRIRTGLGRLLAAPLC